MPVFSGLRSDQDLYIAMHMDAPVYRFQYAELVTVDIVFKHEINATVR